MDKRITEFLNIFNIHNEVAFLVGGAVRDFLMKRKSNDFDVCTSCLPEKMLTIFREYITDTNITYGNVNVMFKGLRIEITTMRLENNYLDNRHPHDITYTNDLCLDLKRRDYTINALAMDSSLKIYDYFDGLLDINNKKIKLITENNSLFDYVKRFIDDPLRVWRGISLSSDLGFEIEEKTIKAIQEKELLKIVPLVSKERLEKEFRKIISGNYIDFALLNYKNILSLVLSVFNSDLINTEYIKSTNDYMLKLGALYYQNQDILEELNKINISKNKINFLRNGFKCLKLSDFTKKTGIKWSIYQFSPEIFLWSLELGKLLQIISFSNYKEILHIYNSVKDDCYSLKDLAINGNDLLECGYSGIKIKNILKILLEEVVSENMENNREKLLKYVKKSDF